MLASLTCEPGATFSRFAKSIGGNLPSLSNQAERLSAGEPCRDRARR